MTNESRTVTISIHASAKEATVTGTDGFGGSGDFNPRLREGGDPERVEEGASQLNFNPRLREGGDFVCSC